MKINKKFTCALLILSIITSINLPAIDVHADESSFTIRSIESTYVTDETPNSNFYNWSYLMSSKDCGRYLNRNRIMLFKIDYDDVSDDRIEVLHASLDLYCYSSNSSDEEGLKAYRITQSWWVDDVTYNNMPTVIDDANPTAWYEVSATTTIDFTNTAKKWIEEGEQNYGIALYNTTTNAPGWFDKPTVSSVTIIYRINNEAPQLSIIEPLQNQVLSNYNTAFVPKILVSDADNDTLTCDYYIDSDVLPRETRQVSNTATAQQLDFNAINIGGLAEGNHTFKFKINDGRVVVESSVGFKVDKSPPVLSSINIAPNETSITVTGSASDSIAGLHASPYRYTVGATQTSWVTSTSYTASSLIPNTEYNVVFEARDKVGHIARNEQTMHTLAQRPNFSVDGKGSTWVTLQSLDANPGITEYQIRSGTQYVSSNGSLVSTPQWVTLTNKRMTVTGLTSNTAYTFSVRARNGDNIATSAQQVSAITLANPPAEIRTDVTQTSVTLTWPSVGTGVTYEIAVDGNEQNPVNTGTSTSYTHSGLTADSYHTYRVRAVNAGGNGIGPWSSLVEVQTLPYPPEAVQNVTVTPTQTSITVTWDPTARAESYDIEVDGNVIGNGLSTTYIHQGLAPKTEHTYRVRAKNRGGEGPWRGPYTVKTLPYPPQTPQAVVQSIRKDSVTILWNPVEDAESYRIKVDGMIKDMGQDTVFVHENLVPLSGHTYQVKAVNAGGESPWSVPIDVTTYPEEPRTPSNIMATAEETAITLTWYEVPHTDSYDIEIDGTTIVTVTDTMYVHQGLSPDEEHTYRVKAKNISGDSPWSSPVTTATLPTGDSGTIALTNVAAVVTNTFITISWDAVVYDAEYDVEVDGVLLDNGKDTIYHHSGLLANEYHTYKIRVRDKEGLDTWCAILSLSTLPDPPDAPQGIQAYATDNSIELRWERAADVTGYDIEVDGQVIDNQMNNLYLHEGLAPGTSHTYRVRAKNITGVTAWSPAIVTSTTNPEYRIECVQEQEFDLSLLANNVQDFTELTFVVEYNPEELEVVDLYQGTPQKDVLTDGMIPGTTIHVVQTPGRIELTVTKNIVPGTSWSGEIAAIALKAKMTGQASIRLTVE